MTGMNRPHHYVLMKTAHALGSLTQYDIHVMYCPFSIISCVDIDRSLNALDFTRNGSLLKRYPELPTTFPREFLPRPGSLTTLIVDCQEEDQGSLMQLLINASNFFFRVNITLVEFQKLEGRYIRQLIELPIPEIIFDNPPGQCFSCIYNSFDQYLQVRRRNVESCIRQPHCAKCLKEINPALRYIAAVHYRIGCNVKTLQATLDVMRQQLPEEIAVKMAAATVDADYFDIYYAIECGLIH